MARYAINEELLQQVETLQSILKNVGSGMFGGIHSSKVFGSSCDFTDLREYNSGDDISKIDWNAYARTEKLYVKKFLDERQAHTRIYIDCSRSMDFGSCHKGDKALEVAATLAYLSIAEMDKVSIYAIKGNVVEDVAVGMLGKDAFYSSIQKLNDIVFEGDSYISEAILQSKVGFSDGMSIIISDFLTDHNFEDAIDYLNSKKRDIFCLQILSPDELKPRIRGKVLLFDSEDIKNDNLTYKKNITRDIVKVYKEALEVVQSRVSKHTESRGGSYLLIDSQKSVKEIFLQNLIEMGVLK